LNLIPIVKYGTIMEFWILLIDCIELRVNGKSLNYAYDGIWFSSICISWVTGIQARGKILGTLAVGGEMVMTDCCYF
jgi:hypothetical protein